MASNNSIREIHRNSRRFTRQFELFLDRREANTSWRGRGRKRGRGRGHKTPKKNNKRLIPSGKRNEKKEKMRTKSPQLVYDASRVDGASFLRGWGEKKGKKTEKKNKKKKEIRWPGLCGRPTNKRRRRRRRRGAAE